MSVTTPRVEANTQRTLDRRRIYIFPTRYGWMLGLMLIVILLGSINYDNALGYLLAFLLFGMFLIAVLHTFRNLTGLSYLGAEAAPVFAGEPARFQLAIDNRGLWPRYALMCVLAPPARVLTLRTRKKTANPATVSWISNDAIATVCLSEATAQRGWLKLPRIQISSVFPLGILRAWAYFNDDVQCLVYPAPTGNLPLPTRGSASTGELSGSALGNDDFAGFRSYQPGDPIRTISWKTLARQDTVLVKRFTGGQAGSVSLHMDDCRSLRDLETRLSQLSAWVVEADRVGFAYGLELPGLSVDPGLGGDHRHRCLRELALFRLP